MTQSEKRELSLRIVVTPLPPCAMRMQRGKSELIAPVETSADALVFDFEVTLAGQNADGSPRLLGPCVQGPATGRFVYLTSGRYAGDPGSEWNRRAKVPLTGLTWALLDALPADGRLTARIDGRARDGGPAVASVKLPEPGWR